MNSARFKPQNKKRGFALLLSIIIASVVLAIGVSILKISVSQLQLSATGRESEKAFQASQSVAECLTYYRYTYENKFTARPGNITEGQLGAPPVDCMGQKSVASSATVLKNSDKIDDYEGHVVKFSYTYSWGSDPGLCGEADLFMMVPSKEHSLDKYPFPNTSLGEDGDGIKTCQAGSVCTGLVTRGYNRPCGQLKSSIFTLQRELTTEF